MERRDFLKGMALGVGALAMPRDRGRPRITGKPVREVSPQHQISLGVYAQYNETRFENEVEALGGSVLWRRRYYQAQSWSSMGAVSTDAAAGYKCYFSFRPNGTTWAQIAAGNEDARWDAIGNGLAGVANAGAWCFNHEPENDVLSYGSAANGAAFVAAWERVASIIKPLAPNWQASINLFDEVFPSWEFSRSGNWEQNPDPNDWLSPEMDLLGVDYHAYRGASDTGSHWATNTFVYDHRTAFADFINYANAYGVKLCVPEFSHIIKDPAVAPNDNLTQKAWFEDFASAWAGNEAIDSIMMFEVNEQDNAGKANFSITDGDHPPMYTPSVQAFVDIGA